MMESSFFCWWLPGCAEKIARWIEVEEQNDCISSHFFRTSIRKMRGLLVVVGILVISPVLGFVPFIDGGKGMPKLYDGWFNEQVAKQAASAVGRAIAQGKTKIEVNFPPVPNVEEVRFGTPLNKKFGTTVVAKDLGIPGGYKPGSDISRQLIAFSNVYWAKKIAPRGKSVCVLTTEPVSFEQVKSRGPVSRVGAVMSTEARKQGRAGEAIICINPGGEDAWDRILSAHTSPGAPFVVLNNAYSTSYGLGNKKGYEEAYYVKRISKGWVFRSFPGPWEAYLEKPDGALELLKSYKKKPELKEVAALVREESFKVSQANVMGKLFVDVF